MRVADTYNGLALGASAIVQSKRKMRTVAPVQNNMSASQQEQNGRCRMGSIRFVIKVILASLVVALLVSCNGAGDKTQSSSNEANRVGTTPATSNTNKAAPAPNASPSKAGGTIEIESTPTGAAVILIRSEDGSAGNPERKGSTPLTITGVAPGQYSIDLEKTGFKSFQKDVDVKENKTLKIRATLKHN